MTSFLRATTALFLLLSCLLAHTTTVEARSSRSARSAPADVTPAASRSATVTTPTPASCSASCVKYRNNGCQTVCCGSAPPIKTVLQVKDPCTCCPVNVAVCVPACCVGTPCVGEARGFLGRHVVWYDWECGFSVKVAFKHSGDVIVTYVNR